MTATQWPRVPLSVASTPAIRLAVEVMDEELRRMSRAFVGVSNNAWGAGVSLDALAATLERAAEREYLKRHSRLPGSTRTGRLRKKRVDRVMRAFWSS
jgi:lipid-binding SYLF domain-containing protein